MVGPLGGRLVGPSVGLLAACLLLLSACQGGASDAPSLGPIRFGLAAAPITLDPRFATDAVSTRINRLLYRRLTDFDGNFQAVPALAEWRQVTPRHYRFTLRAGRAPFHDGAPLRARDVKATYDSILDAASISPHRALLSGIRRIAVLDEDTLDFHLDAPDALFPGRLGFGILPAALLAKDHPFNRQPVGSGPLALVDWSHEGKLRLRRVADGQVIEFLRVPEATVRVLKLLRGEIDLMQNDLLPELVSWLSERADVLVDKARGINFSYLGFHLQDKVAGNIEVRRAVAHALDRVAIIRYVWGGAARQANAILTPEHWAGHPGLEPVPFDPDKARALLREAGYSEGHGPILVYKTSANPFRVRLASVIQDQLRRVGIRVVVRSHDWGTFYGDIKAGRFQLYSLAWVGIEMPDIFRYAFHSASVPPAGANRGRFVDALADGLIEAAEAAPALPEQAEHYRELQAHLLDRLPYVPLWYEDNVLVRRAHITGYALTPNGSYDGLVGVSVGGRQ